MITVCNN